MIFRPDRSGRADGSLEWRVGLFSVAAVLALVGMYFEQRWMTGTAIVVLLAGMLVRWVPPRHPRAPGPR